MLLGVFILVLLSGEDLTVNVLNKKGSKRHRHFCFVIVNYMHGKMMPSEWTLV